MRSALIWAILLTAVTLSAPCGADASTPLTNRDVIDMVAAGLPESTILLSIKQSPAGYSTSPQDLIALKKAGVSPAVMDAMMKAGAGAGSSATTGGDDALVPSAYGQYAVAAGKLQALPTTPVDLVFGIKLVDGGVAADGFKSDREAAVIEDLNPKFIVYAHQLDPRQVKLARLKLVETMTAWQFNVRGSDPGPFQAIYGVSPNKVIDVNLLRAAEPIGLAIEPVVGRAGMYRFTLQRPLQRGEHYALYMGDGLHDIDYLVTAKLNRASVHAVFFATPGVRPASADTLSTQLTALLRRPAAVSGPAAKSHADVNRGVAFEYPAMFELAEGKMPVVAWLTARDAGVSGATSVRISVTYAKQPESSKSVNLDSAVKETLEGTRAALGNASIAGPFATTLAGAEARIFVVQGREEGVMKQKAVTVGFVNNSLLGVVLHATPETFDSAWDSYQKVKDSYTVTEKSFVVR